MAALWGTAAFTPVSKGLGGALSLGCLAAWAFPSLQARLGIVAAMALTRPYQFLTCAFVGDVFPVGSASGRSDQCSSHRASPPPPPPPTAPLPTRRLLRAWSMLWRLSSSRASWSRCTARESCSSIWPPPSPCPPLPRCAPQRQLRVPRRLQGRTLAACCRASTKLPCACAHLQVVCVTAWYYATLSKEKGGAKADHAGDVLFRPLGGFEVG